MSQYRSVFLSHAQADNALCAQYAAALRARGITVWIDLTHGQKGHDLSADIERQLERNSVFLLMVTEASNSSHWVGMELNTYITLYADRQTHVVDGHERMVLPVRLEGVAVPTRVRGFSWIDAVGRPVEQVADEIARAVMIAGSATTVAAAPPATLPPQLPVLPGEPAPTPARLANLGFAARRINGVEVILPPLAQVPAGEFLMGSDTTLDPQAFDNELPQYRIPVRAFAIGVYPLTVAEYACAVRAGAVTAPPTATFAKDATYVAPQWRGKEWSWEVQQRQFNDHPVVMVSWLQVTVYTAWLAQVTGQGWRLPTEAEWEKAARGTEGRLYPWGNQWDNARANIGYGGPQQTTPVGAYAEKADASLYGLHDTAGNVWEWTSTIYHQYPYDLYKSDNYSDITSARELRGGSWSSGPRYARTACRYDGVPTATVSYVGARLALAVGAS